MIAITIKFSTLYDDEYVWILAIFNFLTILALFLVFSFFRSWNDDENAIIMMIAHTYTCTIIKKMTDEWRGTSATFVQRNHHHHLRSINCDNDDDYGHGVISVQDFFLSISMTIYRFNRYFYYFVSTTRKKNRQQQVILQYRHVVFFSSLLLHFIDSLIHSFIHSKIVSSVVV